MSTYDQLGVPAVINAAGTLTRLGGALMDPQVTAAMAEAARENVCIDQLQARVGSHIARLTGAEAALVTAGASAGLTLAAAACICRFDRAKMDRLPDTNGMPAEIVIPRSHRNGYDHALRAAGARLVEVGLAERTRDPQPWEIEAVLSPDTVAVAYVCGFSPLPLEGVVRVAHAHRVPVIVDAAASLPPRAHMTSLIAAGADLLVFSGGKGIRGPQSSGLLIGRRALVASAALQMLDMDYEPALWRPPTELFDPESIEPGLPNHGIGRAMKVGKEEIVGLYVALERFLAEDESQQFARLDELAARIAGELAGVPLVDVSLETGRLPWSCVRLAVRPPAPADLAVKIAARLESGDPPVFLAHADARSGRLTIDPYCLGADDVDPLVRALRTVLASSPESS